MLRNFHSFCSILGLSMYLGLPIGKNKHLSLFAFNCVFYHGKFAHAYVYAYFIKVKFASALINSRNNSTSKYKQIYTYLGICTYLYNVTLVLQCGK